ncbi:glycoside hydrolase family 26 protein [Caballeronia sp. LjRoot31]|uniref:glycoside hydrolase family 26 protein n=1 Tax=Caballeronia sp. LjRoot31 TaxID=3342324 RepID=UPI003ECFCAC8
MPHFKLLAAASLLALSSISANAEQFAAVGLHSEGDSDTSQYKSFGAWLGKPVLYRVVFTARDTWRDVADPYFIGATKDWLNGDPKHVEVMSVPLQLPSDKTPKFSAIISGQQDKTFRDLASNIKSTGHPERVIIRLGWEHNGKWFPWSAIDDPSGYKAAFRRVVIVMRKVAPQIRFDWNTDFQSYSASDWRSAYPGDDVVDIISMDVYDEYHHGWDDIKNADAGLKALRSFARQHQKPEAYPEWSCSTADKGHGDCPSFVENFYAWLAQGAPNVLYQAYWNTFLGGPDAAIEGPGSGRVPLAAAKYRTLFSR